MHQQELARSGKALFKERGNYLASVIVIGAAIVYFSGATGPFALAGALTKTFERIS